MQTQNNSYIPFSDFFISLLPTHHIPSLSFMNAFAADLLQARLILLSYFFGHQSTRLLLNKEQDFEITSVIL